MKTIDYYEIEIGTYHGEPVGRLQYHNQGVLDCSNLYTMQELNNILMLWRMGELKGSFAIGSKLADNAAFQIFSRG